MVNWVFKEFIKGLKKTLRERSTLFFYRKKVKKFNVHKDVGFNFDKAKKNSVKEVWSNFPVKPVTDWHAFYAGANGAFDPRYCPEDFFYAYIEPVLNSKALRPAYSDKNFLDKVLDARTPPTILRCMNGYFYDQDYNQVELDKLALTDKSCVVKPTLEHGGGVDVTKAELTHNKVDIEGKSFTVQELSELFNGNLIIQEVVNQAEELSSINPSSVNTLRVTTLRVGNEIKHLSTVLRFGVAGAFVDNQRAGGASVGVDSNGLLKKYSYDKYGNKAEKHPTSGVVFEGYSIPSYSDALCFVSSLHNQLPYFDMVSWDVIIEENYNPMLLEINLMGQGINLHQFSNGPIFGEYTDYIIDKFSSTRQTA